MRRRTLLGGALAAAAADRPRAEEAVDLLLVLAVDVSRSVDEEEARLQREGYRAAMSDKQVLAAIKGGPVGAIGVAYVEWAGFTYQELVIPWTRIGSAAEANAWSERLARSPRQSVTWTSISGALMFSRGLLAQAPFAAERRVIDVSGDGPNNNGPPPEPERDRLVAEGVTINGLPIVNDKPTFGFRAGDMLEGYYRASVIGGVGAFLIVAEDFESFGTAVRRKLIQEIA